MGLSKYRLPWTGAEKPPVCSCLAIPPIPSTSDVTSPVCHMSPALPLCSLQGWVVWAMLGLRYVQVRCVCIILCVYGCASCWKNYVLDQQVAGLSALSSWEVFLCFWFQRVLMLCGVKRIPQLIQKADYTMSWRQKGIVLQFRSRALFFLPFFSFFLIFFYRCFESL